MQMDSVQSLDYGEDDVSCWIAQAQVNQRVISVRLYQYITSKFNRSPKTNYCHSVWPEKVALSLFHL